MISKNFKHLIQLKRGSTPISKMYRVRHELIVKPAARGGFCMCTNWKFVAIGKTVKQRTDFIREQYKKHQHGTNA